MPICVECDAAVERLYRVFHGGCIRLTTCPYCGCTTDKYIEYDGVNLFLDIVLRREQVYRHILFNFNLPSPEAQSIHDPSRSALPSPLWRPLPREETSASNAAASTHRNGSPPLQDFIPPSPFSHQEPDSTRTPIRTAAPHPPTYRPSDSPITPQSNYSLTSSERPFFPNNDNFNDKSFEVSCLHQTDQSFLGKSPVSIPQRNRCRPDVKAMGINAEVIKFAVVIIFLDAYIEWHLLANSLRSSTAANLNSSYTTTFPFTQALPCDPFLELWGRCAISSSSFSESARLYASSLSPGSRIMHESLLGIWPLASALFNLVSYIVSLYVAAKLVWILSSASNRKNCISMQRIVTVCQNIKRRWTGDENALSSSRGRNHKGSSSRICGAQPMTTEPDSLGYASSIRPAVLQDSELGGFTFGNMFTAIILSMDGKLAIILVMIWETEVQLLGFLEGIILFANMTCVKVLTRSPNYCLPAVTVLFGVLARKVVHAVVMRLFLPDGLFSV